VPISVKFILKTIIDNNISQAAELLKNGEVVAIPTETVYGLAGSALDSDAVLSIFRVKERPFFDPLIIHVHCIEAVAQWVLEIPEAAQKLFHAFSPGPLTILLPKKEIISDLVTAGLPQVAVRIPQHPLTLALLEKINLPLAAPSANPFGYISPTSAQHVFDQLQGKIPMILDGGACQIGVESTIVGFENGKTIVYRLGGLAIEDIEAVIGKVEIQVNSSSNPKAPGLLKSHYAPKKPFFLEPIDAFFEKNKNKKIGVLSFQKDYPLAEKIEILSPKGDLKEAAKNLFSAMRHLDQHEIDCIVAEPFPAENLGFAINDRLQRAAAK
jgi:L-threonylcarbamoyladenylate synthase